MRTRAMLLALTLCFSGAVAEGAEKKKDEPIEGEARVIDAGTIQIGDKVIRLFGVVAPGPRQKCLRGALPWLCGAAARKYLIKLADRKDAVCYPLPNLTGRCIVNKKDLANQMVRAGWAVPNEHGEAYRPAEEKARAEKRGLWESVPD